MLAIEAVLAGYGVYLIMKVWDRLGYNRLNYPELADAVKGKTYRTLVIITLLW